LGWDKGKQDVRFEVLTSGFDCCNKSILDIGCGFGDLNRSLRGKYGDAYRYLGVDMVPDLIAEAKRRYAAPHIQFVMGEFLDAGFAESVDVVVGSGIFNHGLQKTDSYRYIGSVLAKAFALCREGMAFDFLSDRVDYQLPHTFHARPERVMTIGYALSRNVLLRNDYMPFEFCLVVYKDDTFEKRDTLFSRYKRMNRGGNVWHAVPDSPTLVPDGRGQGGR
jgi:SAM-dependent methyltransferase